MHTPEKKYSLSELGVGAVVVAGMIPLLTALLFPLTMLCAWCDLHLWNWFVAPYFHLQPMSLWIAVVLGMWISLQIPRQLSQKGAEYETLAPLLWSPFGHLLVLGIAYLIHLYR